MADPKPSTASIGNCAVCGEPLPANAPGGLCPSCLLRRGIELAARSGAKPGDFIPPAPDELAVLFPEFEIVSLIGRGGMGAVYKAVQTELARTVAIKLLPPETAKDVEFMERFRREATTLARLDHSGIVRLYDYGQRDDFAYFVMEFVDGADLSQRLAAGPMSPQEALTVVSQLCDALQHSHDRGVVHRDLKPANVLIARDGRVKLADFGLARLAQPDLEAGLTRTHARLGTPRYMAPEQMSGSKSTDHRVDVYALGVVLYEMLTTQLPVGHFEPPSERVSTLTPLIDEVVLQALNAEPERRFATMAELKARLQDAVNKPGPTRSQRRRQIASQAFVASAVAAAVGAAAALIWSASRDRSRSRTQPSNWNQPRPSLTAGRLMVISRSPCPLANEQVSSVAVAGALDEFGLVLSPDGRVRAWGDNRFGQTEIPPGLHGVVAVAAGQGAKSAHALALRGDGTVVGWGDNTFRQATPPAGLTGVVAIAAGELHSMALTRDGRVVAWGNLNGPAIAVPENLAPVKAIAAGGDFSAALLVSGRVEAWGLNDARQCQVPQLAASIVEIAAGQQHVVARLEDGKVVAWGNNSSKQCAVPDGLPAVTAVFAGGDSSAALDGSGRLYAWGVVPSGVTEFAGRAKSVAMGSSTWAVIALDGAAPGN